MKEDIYISFLYKKLSQSISIEEQKQLEDWLALSEENRQIAHSVEMSWKIGSGYNDPIVVDLDTDFSDLEEKIDALEVVQPAPETLDTPVREMPRRNWWSVAASLLILISLGYFLRNYFRSANEWNQITVTEKMTEALVLADGTKVWVNGNSTFSRPDNFPVKERRVRLIGEAYFEVAKDPNRPFIIVTESGKVTVLGTSFNVRDFKEEKEMKVEVLTGRVQVQNQDETKKVYLEANEKSIYDKTAKTLTKRKDSTGNALFWKTGNLSYQDQPLMEVIEELEKQFSASIELTSKEMTICPFTSTFKKAELGQILKTIGGVFGIEIKAISTDKYQLIGGICQ